MRLLLLTHSFNSLAQRLHVELRADGHEVAVELDIADSVTEEAVALWQPDVVIAPFLKRRIPESVWSRRLCLVVHPGPPGDRGPAALDWALLRAAPAGTTDWGVTVLQATGDYDAGPVWASRRFALRAEATKSSLYRREVVEAAVAAVHTALALVARSRPGTGGQVAPAGEFCPAPSAEWRRIDWARDDAAAALRKLRAADGAPGVRAELFGLPVRLFDAHPAAAEDLQRAGLRTAPQAPGVPLARRGPALLVPTADGQALWIGQVRRSVAAPGADAAAPSLPDGPSLKLAATRAFAAQAAALPELTVPLMRSPELWDELHYEEIGEPGACVGLLRFDFHNGAMSARQSRRLAAALAEVAARPTQVLVLLGGEDFFSNGIHLHDIEAAQLLDGASAADASLAAIEAIDDVALALLQMTDRWVVSALRGNAGAGGCFLALAADEVWAHAGVIQNPHYKNMGNLYGSEYWTYLLPRRVGRERALALMQERLPLGARQAQALGLVDAVLADEAAAFGPALRRRALALAAAPDRAARVAEKQARRAADEAARPLSAYRAEEIARMKLNFYGFDPSYHVARHHFVHRKPHAWTPRHLAPHRAAGRGAAGAQPR